MNDKHSPSNEFLTATQANLRRCERRRTGVYVLLFALVTAALLYLWLDRTAGERACNRWLRTGEPQLEAITIKTRSVWGSGEATCENEEALRYLQACLAANAVPVADPAHPYYDHSCSIVFRFADGNEYRSPAPCQISVRSLRFSLPGEKRINGDSASRDLAFQQPMPESWKQVLVTLLGPQAFD